MADILLIFPPYPSKYKNAPLGLAYLASIAEKKGFSTRIIDMDPLKLSFDDLTKIIKKEKPEILGISFMTNQFSNALKIAQISKSIYSDVPVVVGGNHVSALPREIISYDTIDFAVAREGELTFLQLVEFLNGGTNNFREIDGLIFKENGTIIENNNRALIQELDDLPFPRWDDFPLTAYSEKILGVKETLPVFSIITTRGCPARCAFCSSHTVFTRKFRKRSAENIFSELQYLEHKFGAQHFNFIDDTLTIDKQRIHDLCTLLIANHKNYHWIANARVNTVDKELLEKMYVAGCRNICFGVESGDPIVRKKIGKGVTEEQIKNAHKWAKEVGLVISSFFMVGNMGETWGSINKTILLAKELQSDHPSCAIATPYPDTLFMKEAEKNNWLITKDWDKYITSPHLDQNFSPVSTNGIFSPAELLQAYYKVNASFAKVKLSTKYGNKYFVNPEFYFNEIGNRIKKQGFKNTLKLGIKLMQGMHR